MDNKQRICKRRENKTPEQRELCLSCDRLKCSWETNTRPCSRLQIPVSLSWAITPGADIDKSCY